MKARYEYPDGRIVELPANEPQPEGTLFVGFVDKTGTSEVVANPFEGTRLNPVFRELGEELKDEKLKQLIREIAKIRDQIATSASYCDLFGVLGGFEKFIRVMDKITYSFAEKINEMDSEQIMATRSAIDDEKFAVGEEIDNILSAKCNCKFR